MWRVNTMYNREDDVCTMGIIGLGDFCELPFASSYSALPSVHRRRPPLQPPTFYIFPMLPAIVTLLAAASPDAIPAPAINVTKCLSDNCKPQVVACSKDTVCDGGMKCVVACPTPITKQCAEACIQKSLDQAMLEVGLCAESHKCIPTTGRFASVEGGAADCDSIKTIDECHSGGCSWCKSAAVPPSCKTKDEARQLPPAVFDCDGI